MTNTYVAASGNETVYVFTTSTTVSFQRFYTKSFLLLENCKEKPNQQRPRNPLDCLKVIQLSTS